MFFYVEIFSWFGWDFCRVYQVVKVKKFYYECRAIGYVCLEYVLRRILRLYSVVVDW